MVKVYLNTLASISSKLFFIRGATQVKLFTNLKKTEKKQTNKEGNTKIQYIYIYKRNTHNLANFSLKTRKTFGVFEILSQTIPFHGTIISKTFLQA